MAAAGEGFETPTHSAAPPFAVKTDRLLPLDKHLNLTENKPVFPAAAATLLLLSYCLGASNAPSTFSLSAVAPVPIRLALRASR